MLNGVDDPIFFALICTMKKRLIAGTMRWGSMGSEASSYFLDSYRNL
jgi:hypothetical protein